MNNYNPFLITSVFLNIGTSIWYFSKGSSILGLLFLGYGFCSFISLFLKIQ